MNHAAARIAVAAVLGLTAALAHRRAVAVTRTGRVVRRFDRLVMHVDRLPNAPQWLLRSLHDAAITTDARVLTAAWGAAIVAVPLVALAIAGPGLGVAAAIACGIGPWLALRLGAGRRAARVQAALPGALEGIARTLRTGGSLRQAVFEAASDAPVPLRDDLHVVAAQVERGAPVALALESWAQRCPLASVRLAVAALALGADTGGAQARAIDGVAATIRERLAAAADVHAQATQARVSGAVIALSPIAFCALSSATDSRTATFLFRTPAGLVLLTAGLALDALGAVWMSRITRVGA